MDTKVLINRRTRRTTLTLEADVADYVGTKLASNKNLKEKNVVNDLLRKGIKVDAVSRSKPFEIVGYKTNLAAGVDRKRIEELLDEI